MSTYGFYDQLQTSETSKVVPLFVATPGGNSDDYSNATIPSRALQNVTDPIRLPNSPNGVKICHIPGFLRYTEATKMPANAMEEDYAPFVELPKMYDASVGVMMAMHHFNNGIGSVVSELEGINRTCTVRLTTEFFDTRSSDAVAVAHLTSLLGRSATFTEDVSDSSRHKAPPCAILGSSHPMITARMASVTGVFDLPQVSPQASLSLLSNRQQYPLFARPTTSSTGSALMAMRYFREVLGTTHLGVLVPDCPYGLDYEKAVAQASIDLGITAEIVSMPAHPKTNGPVEQAIGQLKRSRLRHFFAVTFEYDMVMEVAHREGIAGVGSHSFWLFAEFREFKNGKTSRQYPSFSALANATLGVGFIEPREGMPGTRNGSEGGYERFLTEWSNLQQDDEVIEYFNSKQPAPPKVARSITDFAETRSKFSDPPDRIAFFSYDATVGLGLAACRADVRALDDLVFSGEEHFREYLQQEAFDGSSGRVVIDAVTATRDPSSVTYVVSNVIETDRENGISTFQPRAAVRFDTASQEWLPVIDASGQEVTFIYSDSTSNAPSQLPGIQLDPNYISRGLMITGFVLAAIAMLVATGTAVAAFKLRENVVIRAAQPEFLYLICAGSFILASAIFPAGIDDSIATDEGAGKACVATVWLVASGFSLVFGALCSKTLRVNKIFNSGGRVKRIKVTPRDVMAPLIGILFCNFVVLALWTALSPLQYVREPIAYDDFDRTLSSMGQCQSDQGLIYGLILLFLNVVALLVTAYQAFRARGVQTDFSESTYIGLIIISLLEALFIGTPLLVISADNPSALYFIKTAMIFITSMAVVLLIFVPKLIIVRRQSRPSRSTAGSVRVSGLSVDSKDVMIEELRRRLQVAESEIDSLTTRKSKSTRIESDASPGSVTFEHTRSSANEVTASIGTNESKLSSLSATMKER